MTTAVSTWTPVCPYERILPDTGVTALIDTVQVAVFRLLDGRLFAVGNRCPFSIANVISRGLIGSKGGTPTVASPIYKQRFDLATGVCLDDPAVTLGSWEVRSRDGFVEIGPLRT